MLRVLLSLILAFILASVAGAVNITYRLPKDGRVSLAVYDARERMVRTLLNAEPQTAGPHTVVWDGLDRNGAALPAGEYHWKLLQTQGLTAEYLLNIGTSTLEHWPGNHGGPIGALVVGDVLYMTAGNSESPVTSVKLDLATGKRLGNWNKYSGWNAITDIAFDDTPITIPESQLPEGQLYMPIPVEGRIHVVNPLTGGTTTSDYYRKKFKDPVYFAPLMRLDFTDGQAPAQPGWTAVPPAAYTKEKGLGWETMDGISGFASAGEGDQTGHLLIPVDAKDKKIRTFLIDVPIGGWQQYHITFYLGHPQQACPKFNVYGGLSYDNPALKGAVETTAGEVKAVTYDVMPLPGTQLRLAFGRAGDDFAGCAIRGIEIATGADRVDAYKGKVVIGYSISGVAQELTTDAHQVLASYPVPNLRDVALLADGTLLALAGDRVVKVSKDGLAPLITGLTAPQRLSVDRATGQLFIVEGGESQQIKRYSAAGKLERAFGRPGGRRQGRYVAADFMAVSALAPDGTGGFVITEAESAPRRTAHFDKDGKLLKEWYGGQLWATNAAVDPQHDNRIWLNSHWGWIMEAEVDWAKRTWTPIATYQYGGLAKGLVPGAINGRAFFTVRYRDGQRYLVSAGSTPMVLRVDEAAGKLTPIMVSGINITHYWTAQSPYLQGLLGNARSKFHSYVWNDQNGDGDPQDAEVQLGEWSNWGPGWNIDDRFTGCGIYAESLKKDAPPPNYLVHLLAPEQGGLTYPKFESSKTLTLPADDSLRDAKGSLPQPRDLWRDGAGNYYALLEGSGDGFTGGGVNGAGHATFWPANNSASTAFACWDAAGTLRWQVGSKASSTTDQFRGQLHAPVKVLGEVKGCVGVGDRIVQPAEFWTTDGLYVGGLFDHRADDGLPANYYAWWRDDRGKYSFDHEAPIEYDMVTGGLLFQRKNGEVIYCADGYNNLPTYRITGWDSFARQQGTLRLAAAPMPPAGTGAGLTATYFANATFAGDPALARTDAQLWFGDTERKRLWPEVVATQPTFSVRWEGTLEPRFTETYYLHLYVGKDAQRLPEAAKVWLDGTLILDTTRDLKRDQTRLRSQPLPLTAGQRVPIKVEYSKTGTGELHLCWESISQPIEHIGERWMYPGKQ